ncbi:MAG: hypothetical protein U0353_28695 [Sandaracinus sp.]
MVLGRDILFRWRVAFSTFPHPLVRLGGPPLYGWFDRFQPSEPTVMVNDVPTVLGWVSEGDRSIPAILVALDTTEASSILLTSAALAPFWPAGDTAHDVEQITLSRWGRPVEGERRTVDSLPYSASIGGVLGWPQLVGHQLGWRWFSRLGFHQHHGSDLLPCQEPATSGPRRESSCLFRELAEIEEREEERQRSAH